MATITVADRTSATTSTVETMHDNSSDARRAAAIAKITGTPAPEIPLQNTPKIVQDALGEVQKDTPASTPTPEPDKKAEDHIKSLAAREKQAWAQIKQLKAEKAQLEAEKAKAGEGRLTQAEFIQLLKTDPTKVGLTYDDLGQLYLQQGQPQDPQVARLQAQIEELKGTVTKVTSQAEEQSKAAYQQALKQIETETKALVAKDDRFEVIRSQGAEKAVSALIELTFQEDGVLMSVEDAAAQVEAHLEAEAIALYTKSNKLKAKLAPVDPKQASPAQGTAPQPIQPSAKPRTVTLTPEMSQASAKPLNRRERAILAFQGKLKD